MKQGSSKHRGTLDGVEAFLRVAARRSFTAAAHELGVTPSAVSQTIRALEERVGVPLLSRTTRSVGLTQAGEIFLARAEPAFAVLGDAFEAAAQLGGRPTGRLRINLMRAVIGPLFEPILAGFCAEYPDIELEIFGDDGFADLNVGGFDAGVRLGESLQADMIAVRLSSPFRFVVAGSPAYFERHGRPEKPEDLRNHKCIRVRLTSGGFMPWSFLAGNRHIDVPVEGPVIVNDFWAHHIAMESGIALGYLPEPTTKPLIDSGQVEIVLADYSISSDGLFLYYPSRNQVMPKLRAFIDYVRANLPRL